MKNSTIRCFIHKDMKAILYFTPPNGIFRKLIFRVIEVRGIHI